MNVYPTCPYCVVRLILIIEFFLNYTKLAMLNTIVQSCIEIFSLYPLKCAIDINISKQISMNYGKSVILENLNSVKFSIHTLMRKMHC